MNRFLRPTLSFRIIRTFTFVLFSLAITQVFGQVTINNCPDKYIYLPANNTCQGFYAVPPILTTPANTTVSFITEVATINGSRPISILQNGENFNFGITQVTIKAEDVNNNTDECSFILFVSEFPDIPDNICDDITIDLGGGCMAEYTLPDPIDFQQVNCDLGFVDLIHFSWSETSNEQTLVANAHDGNPSYYSIHLRKYRNGTFIRQGSCEVAVTTINEAVPSLVCPSDLTIEVAPGCENVYGYDVAGSSVIPCDGYLNMTDFGGGPSGTPIGEGVYTYGYEFRKTTGGLDFDGSNDQVSIPHNAALNITGDITVETWVKLDAYPMIDWGRLVGKGDFLTGRSYGLWVRSDGTLLWQSTTVANSLIYNDILGPVLPLNEWVHVAGVRRGGTWEVYFNGVLYSSAAFAAGDNSSTTDPVTLGFSGYHNHINGMMDDVKIWNVGRSASQIYDDAYGCYAGAQTGLVAYYDFEDGTGSSTLTDVVNGYNGSLVNMDIANAWGEGADNCVAYAGASPCSWTVTVQPSDLIPVQMNCLGSINVSIDQNCEATIDASQLLTGNLCTDLSLLTLSTTLPGGTILQGSTLTFTEIHVGKTYKVSVTDPNGLNTCWGNVTIEDKHAPILFCPRDFVVLCTEAMDTAALGIPTFGGAVMMDYDNRLTIGNCEIDLKYMDAVQNLGCSGPYQKIISRTFIAKDASGNISLPCTQTIYVERETFQGAIYPEHYDGIEVHTGISDHGVGSNPVLTCDGAGKEWNTIIREDGRIIPSPFPKLDSKGVEVLPGTGAPGNIGTCGTIFSFYEDLIIDICNDNCSNSSPSFKILRTWDVFDWCTGEFAVHEQLIKVMDLEAPEFTIEVPDVTISTDLWGCGATYSLPTVKAVDQCSNTIKYSWSVSVGTYDPVSKKIFIPSVALTDLNEPIILTATAEDCCGNLSYSYGSITVVDKVPPVAIADQHTVVTLNNQSNDGSTKVHVETFDDGSYDGCGPIDFWVRRMDKACAEYDGIGADGKPDLTEINELTKFQKYVHFCCDDTDEDQMVVFMVCDDADRDGTPEMNGDDNCTTVMVSVDVQDKLAPTIVCPPTKTIDCIEFATYDDYLNTTLSETQMKFLDDRFGGAYSNSTCGELGVQTFSGEDICGIGTAKRTFVVISSTGQATCTQNINIIVKVENVLSCSDITFPEGSPEDILYRAFIKKEYTDKKNKDYDPNLIWCLMNPGLIGDTEFTGVNLPAIKVENCTGVTITKPVIDIDNLCSEIGINLTLDTFNFAGGGCMKILAHWEIIDQCLFQENYEPLGYNEINPFVDENGYYEMYVEYDIFDNVGPVVACSNVTVATTDCDYNYGSFTISATDACTPANIISYTYKVDVGNDGKFEYPKGGGFAEGKTFDANKVAGLGIGKHAIKWITYDGCGNYTTCHQEIEVKKQVKEPTPYCHLGLSSAVMNANYGCSVEFWATDFVAGGDDDCDAVLTYLMIPYPDIYGKVEDDNDDLSVQEARDKAKPNWTFDCKYIENGKSHVVELRIYAIDADGNYDFCDASLTLNDNFDCCDDLVFGDSSIIAGKIGTESGLTLKDIDVSIMTNAPEFPRTQLSNQEGSFMFSNLPKEYNYEINAYNNKNTREGVSTLDLVLIQRHILGIAALDSPYKIIAADINNNATVSASDLLQLRKLILGLYPNDNLPNNTSWRFVDNKHSFVSPAQPFPFDEVVNVNNLSQSMFNQNFVGVKVGDVNGSVSNSILGNANVRSAESFEMNVLDVAFAANDKISVDFTSADVKSLYGMQFGIEFDQKLLQYNTIQAGSLNITGENISVKDGIITVSWNEASLNTFEKNEILFSIEFVAKGNGTLSEEIKITDKTLNSESYNELLETSNINITFRSIGDEDFVLLQNEPNPFSNSTSISFVLPQEGNASIKVYDVTGKLILSKEKVFTKGLNTVIIKGNELNVSGVLYYQLIYGNSSATRKMILMD